MANKDNRTFRDLCKERTRLDLPIALITEIKVKGVTTRRSMAEIVTEAVARGLDKDPRSFGIDSPILTPMRN